MNIFTPSFSAFEMVALVGIAAVSNSVLLSVMGVTLAIMGNRSIRRLMQRYRTHRHVMQGTHTR